MPKFLIDENLPDDLQIWSSSDFIHTKNIPSLAADLEIWQHAISHSLIILKKDTDFYYRHLSGKNSPRIVWFRTRNMTKPILDKFIGHVWLEIEKLIVIERFLIVYREYIEAV